MASTYRAVILFAPSGNSVLNTARNVPLLNSSRISACLASFILGLYALGWFRFITSVNSMIFDQHTCEVHVELVQGIDST